MARTISWITFDLETIPGEEKPGPEDIKVPANYKKEETIEAFKHNPENLEKAWKAQSLSFIKGRVHTIAWKINSEETQSIWHDGTDEEGLFKRWEESLVKTYEKHYGSGVMYGTTWVGHNCKKFDMPYVWLRARKYKCDSLIKMMGQSPRDIKMEDTMLWCNFNSFKDFVSLDAGCKLFNLPGKGDFDGKQVFGAWMRGENDKIGRYGKADVDKTYALAVALGIIIPE